MADQKISQLTPGGPAQAGDELPVARSGTNVKLTANEIASLPIAQQTLTGGTVTVSTPVIDATQTWNAPAITTTGASGNGTTATITFAAQPTAFPIGSTIVVANITPTGYRGTFVVTGSTTTSVSYANATTAAQTVAGTVQQAVQGMRFNVTDTASNAASLLMDLQTGGVSRFAVPKSGGWLARGSATNTDFFGLPSTIQGFFLFGHGGGANPIIGFNWSSQVVLSSGAELAWSSSGGPTNTPDLILVRDAANTLAQRRTTNAQTFRVYGTFTDASNYERGYFTTDANGLTIGTEALGTGTKRPVRIVGPSLASAEAVSTLDMSQTWNTTGTPTAIKLNVTDTASNLNSLLMDVQVGGVSRFTVRKDGSTIGANSGNVGVSGYASYVTTTALDAGFYGNSATAGVFLGSGYDAVLRRDAADTLAQRRTTNAQAFRWYRTFTDTSNYERGALQTGVGQVIVAAETAGTGTDDIDVTLTPAGTGRVRYGTHSAIGAETVTGFIEIKDAGGTIRKIAVVS